MLLIRYVRRNDECQHVHIMIDLSFVICLLIDIHLHLYNECNRTAPVGLMIKYFESLNSFKGYYL